MYVSIFIRNIERESDSSVPCIIYSINAVNAESLSRHSITAVLTVGRNILDDKSFLSEKNIAHMVIAIDDEEDVDFMAELEDVLSFIDTQLATDNGRVLVHCHAGVSRSAAITCAYLMRKESLSVEDALEKIRQNHPTACPNDGFLRQLSLFERMSWKIDSDNAYYCYYLSQLMAQRRLEGYNVTEQELSATEKAKSVGDTTYRCRSCRKELFAQKQAIPHETGKGQEAFTWYKRNDRYDKNAPPTDMCSSHFLVPIKWMAQAIVGDGVYDGKLSCDNCSAKIGSFNWSGAQCSCGAWVSPAFQVNKAKVDGIIKM
ncbi:hypothetical protein SARC_08830 [Sphaeroforma arctica JP610]|uniref:protein-tyrosine-phosphatase n=1 Tax=Sphaeroforma arctica JP610 TaxID=667725 RepID=A0A0L0FPW1_9EUKA|nr:hypothetical protein SARC_08830 [Sphaeroforma arctica JP610]KNC78749.1 hypothetical protein SARC_08830 [Sphaeroforma arctica JP610]|eukprot:XP_014152651.1 hypothetical protein SARC_08830 [Sphaeroforma arctica JP610]